MNPSNSAPGGPSLPDPREGRLEGSLIPRLGRDRNAQGSKGWPGEEPLKRGRAFLYTRSLSSWRGVRCPYYRHVPGKETIISHGISTVSERDHDGGQRGTADREGRKSLSEVTSEPSPPRIGGREEMRGWTTGEAGSGLQQQGAGPGVLRAPPTRTTWPRPSRPQPALKRTTVPHQKKVLVPSS